MNIKIVLLKTGKGNYFTLCTSWPIKKTLISIKITTHFVFFKDQVRRTKLFRNYAYTNSWNISGIEKLLKAYKFHVGSWEDGTLSLFQSSGPSKPGDFYDVIKFVSNVQQYQCPEQAISQTGSCDIEQLNDLYYYKSLDCCINIREMSRNPCIT